MIVTLYYMHILYIYITLNINCHDKTVICFTRILDFITKLALTLFVLITTKSYTYPFIYVFPHHYEYLHSLATLDEDVDGANLGNSTGPNSCNF
jgi:hypothetical protein